MAHAGDAHPAPLIAAAGRAALAGWQQAGHHFHYRGQRIFYRDEGAGDAALLCIHGFPTASWDWHALWPALRAQHARVIAPDMIGFGFSAKPRGYDYSLVDQASLHLALLAQLGITRVHVLAHDYGVSVAQELLARELEGRTPTLQSVTLLNGGLFPETHRPVLMQKLLLGPLGPLLTRLTRERTFARSFSAVFGANTQPSARELHEFWQLVERDGGARLLHRLIRYIPERRAQRERWVGALQRTRVPLRLINGPDDPVSGAHMVARYCELVPNPDVVSLPGIGHYPQVEAPAQVLAALTAFHQRLRA